MVAALGTVLLLFRFVRRTTGSVTNAALAAALLVLSPACFGEHSARTADYDALLLFFVTAYLCLIFLALHRPRPSRALLALIGVVICGAFLTKSVAALVPGTSIVLFALLTGRWRRLASTPGYIVLAIGVAAALTGFLLLREAQAPGYLRAAWFNDVRGCFESSLVVAKSRWFYVDRLRAGYFAAPLLLLLSPLALPFTRGRTRLVLLFSLCIVAATLMVFTCAASKLDHYILTAFPFMAIAAATAFHAAVAQARAALRSEAPYARLLAAACWWWRSCRCRWAWPGRSRGAITSRSSAKARGRGIMARCSPASRRAPIGPSWSSIPASSRRASRITHPCCWPIARYGARGVAIGHATDLTAADRSRGVILASCDVGGVARLRTKGRDIAGVGGLRGGARRLTTGQGSR